MYIYIYMSDCMHACTCVYTHTHMSNYDSTISNQPLQGSGPERGEGLLLRAPRPARQWQIPGVRFRGWDGDRGLSLGYGLD